MSEDTKDTQTRSAMDRLSSEAAEHREQAYKGAMRALRRIDAWEQRVAEGTCPRHDADDEILHHYEKAVRWIGVAKAFEEEMVVLSKEEQEAERMALERVDGVRPLADADEEGTVSFYGDERDDPPLTIRRPQKMTIPEALRAERLRKRALCTKGCGAPIDPNAPPFDDGDICPECGTQWWAFCPRCSHHHGVPRNQDLQDETTYRIFEKEHDWPCDVCSRCGRKIRGRWWHFDRDKKEALCSDPRDQKDCERLAVLRFDREAERGE